MIFCSRIVISITCLTITTYSFCLSLSHNEFNKKLFSFIYEKNIWSDPDSRSGFGSNMRQTGTIRHHIPQLLKKLGIKVLLDAPCGDFYWMKEIDLSFLNLYIGVDIVDQLIADTRQKYESPNRIFLVKDLATDDLPCADLILCRDCLQHLPNESIYAIINNFKRSGAIYLLVSSYAHRPENPLELSNITSPIRIRHLNLEAAPFNFPKPLLRIEEGFDGKTLSLWKLTDLPLYQIT